MHLHEMTGVPYPVPRWRRRSLPATHDPGALRLDPAVALAQRRLHLPLHRVRLVARHPPPPLRVRVTEAPHRWHGTAGLGHAPVAVLEVRGCGAGGFWAAAPGVGAPELALVGTVCVGHF
ncbi:unnamed protein product, partial [Musa hybrid cultivar]